MVRGSGVARLSTCIALACAATAPALHAQATAAEGDQARVLEEVVVTAQKREQGLRDVPLSLVVVSGESIEAASLLELEDLSAQVPAFTVTEAAIATQVFMRGLGSGINQGFEQSVGMYVDGVYAGRGRQFRASFLDLERVEILRGPQGILFGKNTIAGAVNITTAQPTRDFEARLAALGDFDHGEYQFSGAVSGPIGERFAGRLAARAGGYDGWLFNSANPGDEAAVDDRVLRGALHGDFTDRFSATLMVQLSDYEVDGRTTQITQAGDFGPLYGFFDPAFEDRFDTRKSAAGIGVDRSDTESELAILTLEQDFDAVSLTAITGWSAYEFRDGLDIDFGPVPYLFQTEHQDFSQLSQELRLASHSDGDVQWIAGVYFETADLDNQKSIDADLAPLNVPLPPATRQVTFDQDSDSYAVFGQATWDFAARWRLSAGLRYSKEEKTAAQALFFTDFQTTNPNPVLDAIYGSAGFGVAHDFLQSRDEDQWTPQLSLQYEASDAVMLYGTAAQGFKAGGFNESEITGDPDNFAFEDERSTAFEVGAKLRLAGGAARLDLALFHTNYEDLQVSSFQGVSFVVGNAAEATSKGVELEGEWLLSEQFSLVASWAWLDSTYDRFPDAACTIAQTIESGQGAGCTQDLSGQTTQFAPRNSGRIGLLWQRRISGGHGLSAAFDVIHSDGFFVDQDLDPEAFQPAYQKLNLRLAWQSPAGAWEAALLGRNLTDELTRHHGSDVPLLAGAHYSMTDRPRSIALQLRRFF